MSALDKYPEDKRAFVEALEERSALLGDAVRGSKAAGARQWLQAATDATNELLYYLNSPVFDQAIEAFHTSADERAKAATDLGGYFEAAGLKCSPQAKWELHDNNWCVDAQVSAHSGKDVITLSAHYDSETGFGTGVC